jgi:hypothetical protein
MTRPTALPFDGNVVAEIRAYHDASLALLGEAIEALLAGNQTAAEELLSQIDIGAIRREAGWLHLVGHGGDSPVGLALPARQRLSLSDQLKRNVAARDGFCCQFTGLRLVDPEVFQIVGALTESFPWHPNYAKRDTPGGRAGHPMTRTHGFGFEHAYPHAFGGDTNEENIILTSMELNEPKGVRVPPRVVAGHRGWDGFRSVLPRLRGDPCRVRDTFRSSGRTGYLARNCRSCAACHDGEFWGHGPSRRGALQHAHRRSQARPALARRIGIR